MGGRGVQGIVEEMERSSDVKKAEQGKRVVERQLRRVVTPGTMATDDLLGVQEARSGVSASALRTRF